MQIANTILVVSVATFFACASTSSVFGHDSDIGLLNYMARSNDLMQQNPARSLDCFNKYIPLINAIASNYETNFQACLNDSEAASARADEATLPYRIDLQDAAAESCNLLQQCPEIKSVEGIFHCYIDGGSANIKSMYTVQSNASQELAALREQYYLIQIAEFKCTNETKRAYEKQSSDAYAALNNCILGNEAIEAQDTSSTAASTTVVVETSTSTPTTLIATSTTRRIASSVTTEPVPTEPQENTFEYSEV